MISQEDYGRTNGLEKLSAVTLRSMLSKQSFSQYDEDQTTLYITFCMMYYILTSKIN
jgi:hypothetical protein